MGSNILGGNILLVRTLEKYVHNGDVNVVRDNISGCTVMRASVGTGGGVWSTVVFGGV